MVAHAHSVQAGCPVVYQRRQPEKLVLYQAVKAHLPGFLRAADEAERPVPAFVQREFLAFLDGRYEITLKRPWDDGTTAVVVSGEELLARLSALAPPPRVHTVRYFGVWAPRADWRQLVLPEGERQDQEAEQDRQGAGEAGEGGASRVTSGRGGAALSVAGLRRVAAERRPPPATDPNAAPSIFRTTCS